MEYQGESGWFDADGAVPEKAADPAELGQPWRLEDALRASRLGSVEAPPGWRDKVLKEFWGRVEVRPPGLDWELLGQRALAIAAPMCLAGGIAALGWGASGPGVALLCTAIVFHQGSGAVRRRW